MSVDSCFSPLVFMSQTDVASCVHFYLFVSFEAECLWLTLAVFSKPLVLIQLSLGQQVLSISIISLSMPRFLLESTLLYHTLVL